MGRKRIRRRLNGATRMKSSLCFQVSGMSKLRRVKQPKIGVFATRMTDPSLPAFPAAAHAKQSAFVVHASNPMILLIDTCRHDSQVRKSIVSSLPVDVVDLSDRPFAVDVQPSKAMIQIASAVNLRLQVPIAISASGNSSSPCGSSGEKPLKDTSIWIVGKQLAQALLSDHVAPHQSGKPSKDAASGDESPVPRRVSCRSILWTGFAKASICVKIKPLRKMRPAASNEKLRCLYGIA